MNGELSVMGRKGDTKVVWDSDAPAEVDAARRTFNELRGKGYLAYTGLGEQRKGVIVKEFDPQAERIILAPPMQGG